MLQRLKKLLQQIKAKVWRGFKRCVPEWLRIWLRETQARWQRIAKEWLWEWQLLRNVQQDYEKKISELSQRKDKIKCVFLVFCNTKWNGDSLYKKLDSDSRFSPIVVLAILPTTAAVSNREANCQFFTERGYDFAVISNGADLQKHKPDVVFYQQSRHEASYVGLMPADISRYALCLYFHYGIAAALAPHSWDKQSTFYKTLYRNFVFNSAVVEQFQAKGVHNTIATGHPKMDAYLEPVKSQPWKDKEKFKIIYAPHHSVDHCFSSPIRFGTFDWNGSELLEWARTHPDTEWIFKPHPRFRLAVLNAGIMGEDEINAYYDDWNKIGAVYTQGDYFDVFRTADLLITDCFSFLTEWLPTEKPCIHLLTVNDAHRIRSPVHENSSRHYYKVKNMDELNGTMEMLVVRREDPLAKARIQDAKNIPLDCAKNIHHWLIETLWGQHQESTEP